MLQDLLNVGDFALFKEIKEKYDPQLKRDPTFIVVSHYNLHMNLSFSFSIWIRSLKNGLDKKSRKKVDLQKSSAAFLEEVKNDG